MTELKGGFLNNSKTKVLVDYDDSSLYESNMICMELNPSFIDNTPYPEKGTEYFYINKRFSYIGKAIWNGSLADLSRYWDNNIYNSKEDCRKEFLKEYN